MTRAHATRNREEDRVIGLIDRARKVAPRPRTDDEREFALRDDIAAKVESWAKTHDPAQVASMLNIHVGALYARATPARRHEIAHSFFVQRTEGDVPSAGMEP